MKRLWCICLLLLCALLLFSCNKEETPNNVQQGGESSGVTGGDAQTPAAHTHAYGKWETVLAATCLAKGEEVRRCACGQFESREVGPYGHSVGEWEIVVEPDFRNDGLKQKRCVAPQCPWVLEQVVIPAGTLGDLLAEPTQSVLYLNRAEKWQSEYVIVYDYKCSAEVMNAISVMQDAFKDWLCTEISAVECYYGREDDSGAVRSKEILVGLTDRPETAQVMNGMRSNDYAMDIVGEKLVLAGGNDDAVVKAIAVFLTKFVYEQGDRNAVRFGEGPLQLVVGKNVSDGSVPRKYDVAREECHYRARYNYEQISFGAANVQDCTLIYAASSTRKEEYKAFAADVQVQINKLCGISLDAEKDGKTSGSGVVIPFPNEQMGDFTIRYEDDMLSPLPGDDEDLPALGILIGNTCFTDVGGLDLAANEYYISLNEKIDAAGERHVLLTVLFGDEAYDAAMDAFSQMLLQSANAEKKLISVAVGYVSTNQAD